MVRRAILALLACSVLAICLSATTAHAEQQAFNRVWGGAYGQNNWERFYHYPYVFYPQNFWGNEYYRSAESLYYRYPPEMRIPVYNKKWHNELPAGQLYHSGHHFITDMF